MKTSLKSIKQKGLRCMALSLASLLMFNCAAEGVAENRNHEAVSTNTAAEPDTPTASKKIKIALLLDTSNSMDGLIEQAKSQLWTMVNELAKATCPDDSKPSIQIALYEYGNDRLTASEGYIRMVTPLTDDLDKLSGDLFKLTTNGGSEFCGHVINTSLSQLDWGLSGEDLQVIFIAGNEPFTQGGIDYKQACARAKNKNVIVNTIYCGDFNSGIVESWKSGADLTGGSYMSINHNQKTVFIESPYDDQISNLNINLNNTYIYYGNQGVEKKQMQIAQDASSETYGKQNSVNRAVSKSSHVYKNSSWDLVDAKKENKDITKVDKQSLPKELQGMNNEQLKAYVEQKEKERAAITKQIQELNVKREEFIKEKTKTTTSNANTLDDAMMKAIHEQAKSKRLEFKK